MGVVCDAANRCGVRRELVVSRHLLLQEKRGRVKRRHCITLLGGVAENQMPVDRMKRRKFIAMVLAAAAWPQTGSTQSATTAARVVLLSAAADPAARLRVFREHLSHLGYVEGRNITLDIRSAEGHLERLAALAEGLAHESGTA